MINRPFFFNAVRDSIFGGSISQSQVNGLNAILDEWDKSGLKDDRWLGYMLGTTYHETAATMQPIEEFGKGRKYDYGRRLKMSRKPYTDTTAIFYGRGYVQLTWYENYDKAGKKLGLNLLSQPELALNPDVAAKIKFAGMQEGWFTSRKLSDYFNDTKEDWVNARRIINGTDKAELIAGYAKKFHAAISHV